MNGNEGRGCRMGIEIVAMMEGDGMGISMALVMGMGMNAAWVIEGDGVGLFWRW